MDKELKAYLDSVENSRREKLLDLHQLIMQTFPDIHADMQYKMPTYSKDDGWVALANRKNYISVYTCGYHHIESYLEKHPHIKSGKGCLNFKDKDEINLSDLRVVIQHAILYPKP